MRVSRFILLCFIILPCFLGAQNDTASYPDKQEIAVSEYNKQDTYYLKVHFLYGSKPKRKFRKTEKKWFGGILGGHVGVEVDNDSILNFCPKGKFHIFQHKNKHSCYLISSADQFSRIHDMNADSVKKLTVSIPITKAQKIKFDSIQTLYMANSPYDYAFFGMRCGAAAYDVLSSTGIVKKMGYHKTWSRIFYPRRLRKRIIKLAVKNNWEMQAHDGSFKRKWEKD